MFQSLTWLYEWWNANNNGIQFITPPWNPILVSVDLDLLGRSQSETCWVTRIQFFLHFVFVYAVYATKQMKYGVSSSSRAWAKWDSLGVHTVVSVCCPHRLKSLRSSPLTNGCPLLQSDSPVPRRETPERWSQPKPKSRKYPKCQTWDLLVFPILGWTFLNNDLDWFDTQLMVWPILLKTSKVSICGKASK